MSEQPTPLPGNLQAAAHALGQSLAASEPFTHYVRSQTNLTEDQAASDLLDLLIAVQNDFRRQQSKGGASQAELEQLKQVQAQVQENAAIMEYANSQQAAIAFQKEIVQELSQQLGMDFALIAKRTCA
jgi:cell fate (sporulation/competence/biofilm development) regulator YlbF (YheA/YmcA/DUF963 family)